MNNKKLKETLDKSLEKSGIDHIRSIFSAFLNLYPPIGGALSSLVNDYIPSVKQLRFEKFWNDVVDKIEKLEDEKIDLKMVKTESFAFLFEKVVRNVSTNYQKEKLEAFKSIIINSLKPDSPSDHLKEYYLNLVEQFTPIHITVLMAVKLEPKTYIYKDEGYSSDSLYTKVLQPSFDFELDPYPKELVMSTWRDLMSKGIVTEKRLDSNPLAGVNQVEIEGNFSEFGEKFIKFITL